jgi:MscS family membrane protein
MDAMLQTVEQSLYLDQIPGWLIESAVLLLSGVFASAGAWVVLERIRNKLRGGKRLFLRSMLAALRWPLQLFIWLTVAAMGADILHGVTESVLLKQRGLVLNIAKLISISWFCLRLVREYETRFLQQRKRQGIKVDRTLVDAISKVLKILTVMIAGLTAMQMLGFSLSGLLALGGAGGIAVGFASKDILANIFAALSLYTDRPFAVGDWVRSPDRGIEGVVESIGWRQTIIMAFQRYPIYVPNSLFATIIIENPGRMTHRRFEETVGLRYQDFSKVEGIIKDIESLFAAHPDIDQEENNLVFFNAYNASSLDVMARAFVTKIDVKDFMAIRSHLLLEIGRIIEKHGAEIAFPTRTLHITQDEPEPEPPAKKTTKAKVAAAAAAG